MSYIVNKISRLPRGLLFLFSYILLLCLGIVDYLIGPEISFSLFYLMPILVTTWFAGRNQGIVISIASSVVWGCADYFAGNEYSSQFIPYWNAGVRFSFYLIVALLISEIKKLLETEKLKASIDSLTGLYNSRAFYEIAEREIRRSRRYGNSFALAYIDLDNFKTVNDTSGHLEGDKLLIAVAGELKKQVRATDTAARLGGDEFVVLLSQIKQADALNVIQKIQESLLAFMSSNQWPVTISVGTVFFQKPPQTASAMIKYADDLMYEVKKSGKNGIKEMIYK